MRTIWLDLAQRLTDRLTKRRNSNLVLKIPDKRVAMFWQDLEAAGIDNHNAPGRLADFHGLHHTLFSKSAASGASSKMALELARHERPPLTIGRFAHAGSHDPSTALSALPGVYDSTETAARVALGTVIQRLMTADTQVQGERQRMSHDMVRREETRSDDRLSITDHSIDGERPEYQP